MKIFKKSVEKIPVPLQSEKNNGTLHEGPYYTFISCSFLLGMRNISDSSFKENQNTYFVFSTFFFSKIVPFMRKCGKILQSGAGHRCDMAHAHFMLDT